MTHDKKTMEVLSEKTLSPYKEVCPASKSYLLGQIENINNILQTTIFNQFILQQAYGGFQLQQRVIGGGNAYASISPGYVSKKEMYKYLVAFTTGMSFYHNHQTAKERVNASDHFNH